MNIFLGRCKSLVALLWVMLSLCACTTTYVCAQENGGVPTQASISNFSECVAAGNPIMRTYPARCMTADGRSFTDSAEISPQLDEPSAAEATCKDLCGDGVCQELVCMAIGCPCAETPESCPADCKD